MLKKASELFNTAINKALALDPDMAKRFSELNGKVIEVHFTDLSLSFFMIVDGDQCHLQMMHPKQIDTTVKGTVIGFFRTYCQGATGPALFKNRIDIEGDIEVGEKLRDIMQHFDIDWEEQLSHFVGDDAAHIVGRCFSKTWQVMKETKDRVTEQLSEYLRFESDFLIDQDEVESFYDEVSQFRNAVDRCEAKIRLLEEGARND